MSGRQSLQPPKLTQIAPKAIDTDRRGSPTRMNHIANRRQQRRVNQRRPQTKEHCSRHPHPASESKFSILYFQHLQNRSVKMYVHALHTAHELTDLPATAGRLGTTTSNLRICFGRIRLCLCHARWLLKENTNYAAPDDWVFASPRVKGKSSRRPDVVLTKILQPAAVRAGIKKRIGWHTFRHTYSTTLIANGENVKVVQELMRHANGRCTLDVYSQAKVTAKREAQQRIVEMIISEDGPTPEIKLQ